MDQITVQERSTEQTPILTLADQPVLFSPEEDQNQQVGLKDAPTEQTSEEVDYHNQPQNDHDCSWWGWAWQRNMLAWRITALLSRWLGCRAWIKRIHAWSSPTEQRCYSIHEWLPFVERWREVWRALFRKFAHQTPKLFTSMELVPEHPKTRTPR